MNETFLKSYLKMREEHYRYRFPWKIKVTKQFYSYIVSECTHEVILLRDEEPPYRDVIRWRGTVIEIDDTIENDYELIY